MAFLQSLKIAVSFTACVAFTVLGLDRAHARPSQQEVMDQVGSGGGKIVVNIDKSTQKMTVSIDGAQTYIWPVSTGMPGYSTPSGNFTATSMNEIWYSKEFDNAPMPHAVFFIRDGHAIHATYDVKHLGRPASHGCVRLSPQNAATFFSLVKKSGLNNTQVIVGEGNVGGDRLVRHRDQDEDQPASQPASRPVRQVVRQPARQVVRQPVRQPAPAPQEPVFPSIFGFR